MHIKSSFFCYLLIWIFPVESVIYPFIKEPIDVVIPCIEKDVEILNNCIAGIRTHGINIRRIITVSHKPFTDQAEWFDERYYPFNKKDIYIALSQEKGIQAKKYLEGSRSRVGWYYQQLLKLYAPFVIPNISSNVLVIDADTVFLNDVAFLNQEGAGLYNVGNEYTPPYFTHIKKLFGGTIAKKFPKYSGISHHMLFQKSVLEDIFRQVAIFHPHQPFWKVFCHCVGEKSLFAGASEYEIYFNFVFSNTNQVQLRFLKWKNVTHMNSLREWADQQFHYVSCHAYKRTK